MVTNKRQLAVSIRITANVMRELSVDAREFEALRSLSAGVLISYELLQMCS